MHQLAIAIACYSYITIPAIFSECSYTVATVMTFSNIFSVQYLLQSINFIARQTAILIISKMKNSHSVKRL